MFIELLLDARQSHLACLLVQMLNRHYGEGRMEMRPGRPGQALDVR